MVALDNKSAGLIVYQEYISFWKIDQKYLNQTITIMPASEINLKIKNTIKNKPCAFCLYSSGIIMGRLKQT